MNGEQISIFEMLEPCESRFTAEIKCGSGVENSRVRIFCASCHLDVPDLAKFLKEEYGYGGHTFTFPDGERGVADHTPNGIELRMFGEARSEKHSYTEAAREVKRLILRGEYLRDEDQAKLQRVLEHTGGAIPLPVPRFGMEGIKWT